MLCAGPSLRGPELVIDPGAARAHYGAEPIAAELVVARYRAEGVPYQALRDGQAIVIDA